MGNLNLKFSKLTIPGTSNFYSTASNFNSTIRVQADFTNGSPTVTNVVAQPGWNGFGTGSIVTGMFLVSSWYRVFISAFFYYKGEKDSYLIYKILIECFLFLFPQIE